MGYTTAFRGNLTLANKKAIACPCITIPTLTIKFFVSKENGPLLFGEKLCNCY